MTVREFVVQLAISCSHKIGGEQLELYIRTIQSTFPTDAELDIAWRALLEEMAKSPRFPFPNLGLICGYIRGGRLSDQKTEPVFRTWLDKNYRFWASPIRGTKRAIAPTDHDVEGWRENAAPQDVARQAYLEGLMEAGVPFLKASAMARGVPFAGFGAIADAAKSMPGPKKRLYEQPRQSTLPEIADYDDSMPEFPEDL